MTEALALIGAVLIAVALIAVMAAGNAAYARREQARNAAALKRLCDAFAGLAPAIASAAAAMTAFGVAIRAAAEFDAKRAQIEHAYARNTAELTAWVEAIRETETR